MRAYDVAAETHAGEYRLNGAPYLAHCVAVALIVARVQRTPEVVAAALLHDVVEPHRPPTPQLRLNFGHDVVDLIEAAADLDRYSHLQRDLNRVDSRVILLKLADRLHNLHTIDALRRHKQVLKAEHTLAVLVPLADTTGIPLGRQLRDVAADTLRSPKEVAKPRRSGCSMPRGGVSAGLIRVAAALLSPEQQDRWLTEWRAELHSAPNTADRLRYAIHVLLGAPTLAALTRRDTPPRKDKKNGSHNERPTRRADRRPRRPRTLVLPDWLPRRYRHLA